MLVRPTSLPYSTHSAVGAHSKVGLRTQTESLETDKSVPQLPQSTYHSLGLPYAFIGLGRTNNYVEVSNQLESS